MTLWIPLLLKTVICVTHIFWHLGQEQGLVRTTDVQRTEHVSREKRETIVRT